MDDSSKIQELQILEQSLQNVLFQKQAFEMELSETQSAISEINNSSGEVFKIVGQLMIKSDSKKILNELKNKEKLIELRINSLEKQESSFSEKVNLIREEILKNQKKK